jgi:hypothetical protein
MQLPEITQDILRTNLDGAAAAGVKPGRAAGHHLQSLHGGACGCQHGKSVGFGVESIDRLGLA